MSARRVRVKYESSYDSGTVFLSGRVKLKMVCDPRMTPVEMRRLLDVAYREALQRANLGGPPDA